MASSQYDTNVITKAMSSDRVEFAIKIPCSGGFVYLPIDSKMPTESYERFCNAQDKAAEKEALRQLEQRIKAVSYTHLDVYKRQTPRCSWTF